MNELSNVGRGLAVLRQRRDISRPQLAELAEVSVSAVYTWENEEALPTFTTLSKLLNALEASRYDLLNALLQLHGETPRKVLPARSGDNPLDRELLDLLDLDLSPSSEAAFLAMLTTLRNWFLAENPPPEAAS